MKRELKKIQSILKDLNSTQTLSKSKISKKLKMAIWDKKKETIEMILNIFSFDILYQIQRIIQVNQNDDQRVIKVAVFWLAVKINFYTFSFVPRKFFF